MQYTHINKYILIFIFTLSLWTGSVVKRQFFGCTINWIWSVGFQNHKEVKESSKSTNNKMNCHRQIFRKWKCNLGIGCVSIGNVSSLQIQMFNWIGWNHIIYCTRSNLEHWWVIEPPNNPNSIRKKWLCLCSNFFLPPFDSIEMPLFGRHVNFIKGFEFDLCDWFPCSFKLWIWITVKTID